MLDKTFLVTKSHVVKAKNMKQARSIAEGDENLPGDILVDDYQVEEVSEDEVSQHFLAKGNSLYNSMSDSSSDEYENEKGSDSVSLNEIQYSTVDFLRSENKRLAKQVEKLKNISEEASSTIYRAAYDAFANFKVPNIPKRTLRKSGNGSPETAVVVFSDWQLGKVTPDYNSEVLAKRIELYTEKMLDIVEVQRADHPVDNLHVWFLGDIVEGEEIFPGQSHLIDSGIYRQVGVNGPEILAKFFSAALENFEKINVTAVIGNHGSVGGKNRKMYDPESNMDRLLYKIVSLIFAENKKIKFNIPDGRGERHWYAVDKIGNYSTLLIHGDQLPSPSAVSAYGRKILGWKDGAIPEEFQDVFMGHYHQQTKMTIGSSTLRISGSPESYNTYAQEYFNSMSRPSQQLLFVHPENGITSEYSVWLDAV